MTDRQLLQALLVAQDLDELVQDYTIAEDAGKETLAGLLRQEDEAAGQWSRVLEGVRQREREAQRRRMRTRTRAAA